MFPRYSLLASFLNLKIVCNIMLKAIACGCHQDRLVNVMDIKMILHIVFVMFLNLETVYETILRQQKKDTP